MIEKRRDVPLSGLGLVFGTAFGYLVGAVIGNVGLGIALGAAFGLLSAPVLTRARASVIPPF